MSWLTAPVSLLRVSSYVMLKLVASRGHLSALWLQTWKHGCVTLFGGFQPISSAFHLPACTAIWYVHFLAGFNKVDAGEVLDFFLSLKSPIPCTLCFMFCFLLKRNLLLGMLGGYWCWYSYWLFTASSVLQNVLLKLSLLLNYAVSTFHLQNWPLWIIICCCLWISYRSLVRLCWSRCC